MSPAIVILVSVAALLVSFYALHRVTDQYFVESLDLLAKKMKLPSDIAGATLMAIGSSAPELLTSLMALVKGTQHAGLGVGTIVGSALFNILVIVGASACVRRATLTWQPVVRDLLFYILTVLILFAILRDGQVTLVEAAGASAFYLVYLIALPLWRRVLPYKDSAEDLEQEPEIEIPSRFKQLEIIVWSINGLFTVMMPNLEKKPHRYLEAFALSIAAIPVLSWVLVEAGVALSTALGVPGAVIGLTVLAVGTSVPDLLASVMVAKQGRSDMAVSNAVGSNIFDILIGLGLVWVAVILVEGGPILVDTTELESSVVLLLTTVAGLAALLLARRWRIAWPAGTVLLLTYFAYVGYIVSISL